MGATASSRLARFVWNGEERRPSAPARLVLGVAVVAVVQVGATLALQAVLPAERSPLLTALVTYLQFGLLGVGVLAAALVVDRRTVADLGLGIDRDWWLDLGFGLALGAVLMTGIFLVALAADWVSVTDTFVTDQDSLFAGFLPNAAFVTGLFVLVGIVEEVAVRGWLLTNLAEGLDGFGPVDRRGAVALAVAGSSAVFGVLHATNPNATVASVLGITLAGVMLAAGYVLTDDLAIPSGLHITWNLFQGTVYGFPVSGIEFGVRLLQSAERGPDLLTGGRFGPEAGLLGVGAVVAGTGLIVLYVRRRYGGLQVAPGVTVPALRWGDDGAGDTNVDEPETG